MTFSMMFGSQQNGNEEYSTDEDGDGNYYDDDEDDDDEYGGEDDEDENQNPVSCGEKSWDPPAKVYSNMNLKGDGPQIFSEQETASKKLKQAKKRAEKRKKQKERRNKEKENIDIDAQSSDHVFSDVDVDNASPEVLEKLICYHQNTARKNLLQSIDEGSYESFEPLIICSFQSALSPVIADSVANGFKSMLPELNLFHRCITDFSEYRHLNDNIIAIPEEFRIASQNRVHIAEKLFELNDPVLDFAAVDEAGLSILHRSVVLYDVEYAKFVVRTISHCQNSNRKISLNLNSRCHKKGWAPIHYAVDNGNIPSIRLLAHAGANLQASSATDKRMVPIELAKSKIKSNQANTALKERFESVLSALLELISWQKSAAKEAEKLKKGEIPDSATKTSSHISTTKAIATPEKKDDKKETGKSTDKKKKKGDKKKEDSSSDAKPSQSDVSKEVKNDIANVSAAVSAAASASNGVTLTSGAIISLASHDEMMDNLLAMGFQESDCLQAIQLYGTDLDNAISWLCERPPVEKKKKEDSSVLPMARTSSSSPAPKVVPPISKKTSSTSDVTPTAFPGNDISNPSSAQSIVPPRSTSKGWNIKEEDRKAKIDNVKPIIPLSEFGSLPAISQPVKPQQSKAANPEFSKRGPSSAVPVSKVNKSKAMSKAVALTPAPVFDTEVPALPSVSFDFDAVSTSFLQNPLTASSASTFLPAFTADRDSSHGSLGLDFGSSGQLIGINLGNTGFDLPGGISSFGSGFSSSVNQAPSFLQAIGSVTSDQDTDFSIAATGGAIELSAGAKPFVPKSFTPITNAPSILSSTTTSNGISASSDFSFIAPSSTSSLVGGNFGSSLQSIDDPLRLLSQPGTGSLWSSTSVGLGIATNSGLGVGLPMAGQGSLPDYLSGILSGNSGSLDLGLDSNDMMPDLDSLLPTDL